MRTFSLNKPRQPPRHAGISFKWQSGKSVAVAPLTSGTVSLSSVSGCRQGVALRSVILGVIKRTVLGGVEGATLLANFVVKPVLKIETIWTACLSPNEKEPKVPGCVFKLRCLYL